VTEFTHPTRFADAREDAAAAEAIYSELGLRFAVAGLTQVIGPAELLAGDAAAAETALRRGYEILRAAGAAGLSAAQLSEALYIQGRFDEAADFAEHAQASAPAHDIATHAVALGVSAKVAAHSGDQQAVARAQPAVELARETEAVNLIGEALANHALTFKALSQTGRADELAAEAIAAFRRKRNRAAIQSVERTFAAARKHLGERRLGFPPSRE
jgi:tetratricopeptide (TPR) repeat protein